MTEDSVASKKNDIQIMDIELSGKSDKSINHTKRCRACDEPISKHAQKCKECGSHQGRFWWFQGQWLALIGALIAAISASAAITQTLQVTDAATSAAEASTSATLASGKAQEANEHARSALLKTNKLLNQVETIAGETSAAKKSAMSAAKDAEDAIQSFVSLQGIMTNNVRATSASVKELYFLLDANSAMVSSTSKLEALKSKKQVLLTIQEKQNNDLDLSIELQEVEKQIQKVQQDLKRWGATIDRRIDFLTVEVQKLRSVPDPKN